MDTFNHVKENGYALYPHITNPKQQPRAINESLLTHMISSTLEEGSHFGGTRRLPATSQLQLRYVWDLWVSQQRHGEQGLSLQAGATHARSHT